MFEMRGSIDLQGEPYWSDDLQPLSCSGKCIAEAGGAISEYSARKSEGAELMRDYGKVHTSFWIDENGQHFPVPSNKQRPTYKYRSHSALRAFVYRRDNFSCRDCGITPIIVPENYNGRITLTVPRRSKAGFNTVLVVDHILSLRNGGTNHPENLQTLCECCNAAKSGLVDSKWQERN